MGGDNRIIRKSSHYVQPEICIVEDVCVLFFLKNEIAGIVQYDDVYKIFAYLNSLLLMMEQISHMCIKVFFNRGFSHGELRCDGLYYMASCKY